jgi:hypothetical protein
MCILKGVHYISGLVAGSEHLRKLRMDHLSGTLWEPRCTGYVEACQRSCAT